MAKLQKQTKQNPKLEQRELKDERIALYLEYYLGQSEEVVKDTDGNVGYYNECAMNGKPKKKVTHPPQERVAAFLSHCQTDPADEAPAES